MNATEGILLPEDKAIPILRSHELDENSTRFDHIAAAPPDEELVKYWYSWTAVAFICGIFSLLVCLSIVLNRKVRKKPFNLYLIFLMIPDFTFSILCGTTCLLNALKGSYYSHDMCNFQQLYVVFGIGANAWLNSIIAHQLHMILKKSNIRQRYKLPTRKQVTIHAMVVYAWCLFLGSWGYNNSERFPFESGQASGLACLPMEGKTTTSVVFFWAFFFPIFAGIPIFYVLWICWDIYYRKLMPPPGQRRLFTMYFGRLILVFLVMWIPTLLFLFLFSGFMPDWVHFAGGTWSHLQGGLSAILVLMKPDIKHAFRQFLTCNFDEEDESFGDSFRRQTISHGSSGRRSSFWWPRDEQKLDLPRRSSSICGNSSQDLQSGFPPSASLHMEVESPSSSQKLDSERKNPDSSQSIDIDEDHVIPIKD